MSNQDELSIQQRQEILNREISKYIKNGFRVVSQTETTAQLVKPKEFSCLLATIFLILAVFPFIIYLLWYLAKKDETIYLEVTSAGKVIRR